MKKYAPQKFEMYRDVKAESNKIVLPKSSYPVPPSAAELFAKIINDIKKMTTPSSESIEKLTAVDNLMPELYHFDGNNTPSFNDGQDVINNEQQDAINNEWEDVINELRDFGNKMVEELSDDIPKLQLGLQLQLFDTDLNFLHNASVAEIEKKFKHEEEIDQLIRFANNEALAKGDTVARTKLRIAVRGILKERGYDEAYIQQNLPVD